MPKSDKQSHSLPPILRLPPELTKAIARHLQPELRNQDGEKFSWPAAHRQIRSLAALCRTCVQLWERLTPLLYHAFLQAGPGPSSWGHETDQRVTSMITFSRSLQQRPLLASFVKLFVVTLSHSPGTRFNAVNEKPPCPQSSKNLARTLAPLPYEEEHVTMEDRSEYALAASLLLRTRNVVDLTLFLDDNFYYDIQIDPRIQHAIRALPINEDHAIAGQSATPNAVQLQKLTIDGNCMSVLPYCDGPILTLTEICRITSLAELTIGGSVGLGDGLDGINNTAIKSIRLHGCVMPMSAIAKLIRSSIKLEHVEIDYRGSYDEPFEAWSRIIDLLRIHRDHLRTIKLSSTFEWTELGPDFFIGSFRDFVALDVLSVPKEAILGPDCWRREGIETNTARPDLSNLVDCLPRSLRSFAMSGCSISDLDQLRELISSKNMTALARIDVESGHDHYCTNCHDLGHLIVKLDLHSEDDLRSVKTACLEAGVYWVPESESDYLRWTTCYACFGRLW